MYAKTIYTNPNEAADYPRGHIDGAISATKLRNAIKKLDPTLDASAMKNENVNRVLQGCSGFVVNPQNNNVVYVNTDLNHGTSRDVYVRYARNTKDYSGGRNRLLYNNVHEIAAEVVEMLHGKSEFPS